MDPNGPLVAGDIDLFATFTQPRNGEPSDDLFGDSPTASSLSPITNVHAAPASLPLRPSSPTPARAISQSLTMDQDRQLPPASGRVHYRANVYATANQTPPPGAPWAVSFHPKNKPTTVRGNDLANSKSVPVEAQPVILAHSAASAPSGASSSGIFSTSRKSVRKGMNSKANATKCTAVSSSGRKTVVVPRRGQKRGREDTENHLTLESSSKKVRNANWMTYVPEDGRLPRPLYSVKIKYGQQPSGASSFPPSSSATSHHLVPTSGMTMTSAPTYASPTTVPQTGFSFQYPVKGGGASQPSKYYR